MPTIPPRRVMYGYKSRKGVAPFHGFALCVKSWCRIFPRTISGISDTNLSAAPAHGRLKKEQNRKREAQQRPLPNPLQGSKSYNKPHSNHLKGQGVPSNRLKHSKKRLPPLGRALKNYRYFHFIGVVRRHYRAFTRRSGYDVW